MSVGKGSIKRAAGTVDPKKAASQAKTEAPKQAPDKKVTKSTVQKQTKPQAPATSQQDSHYGLGSQLPIHLM